MYKQIYKNTSFENISRSEYGLTTRASDLEKLNNNTSHNKIIIYAKPQINKFNENIDVIINNQSLNNIKQMNLFSSLQDVKSAIIYVSSLNNIQMFDNCFISINKDLFLQGFVKNITPILNKNDNYYILQIKSINGLLLDTVVPNELEFINSNLQEIISKICNIFNINVIFSKTNNIINYKISNEINNSISAGLNESCWHFIIRLCNSRGLLVQDCGDFLNITKIINNKSKANFIYGDNNITSWLPIYNYDNLARYYEFYSQFNNNYKELITFDLIKLPITKRIINKDLTEGITIDYGKWFICRELGKAIQIQINVINNINLKVGDYVDIQNINIGFEKQTTLIIDKININYPNITTLILTLPCAYSGILPDCLPFI